MSEIQIFVEGTGTSHDKKFVCDLLRHLGKNIEENKIVPIGGYTQLARAPIIARLKENTINEGVNLVIFDADTDFVERRNALNQLKQTHQVEFELFLMPNNADQGKIETLIFGIIALHNFNDIFACFNAYSNCVGANPAYKVPDEKTRFYAFTYCSNQGTKGCDINFRDHIYYNLDHASLNPLKDFLTLHIP
jgi:hypothetical protein